MGHELCQTDTLGVLPRTDEIMPQPGILYIHARTQLLHQILQAAHFLALRHISRTAHEKPLAADGGLKGNAVDVFMQHCHRLHQQKGAVHDLISHDNLLRFHRLL